MGPGETGEAATVPVGTIARRKAEASGKSAKPHHVRDHAARTHPLAGRLKWHGDGGSKRGAAKQPEAGSVSHLGVQVVVEGSPVAQE